MLVYVVYVEKETYSPPYSSSIFPIFLSIFFTRQGEKGGINLHQHTPIPLKWPLERANLATPTYTNIYQTYTNIHQTYTLA
jgi:hypothetical protein